jgi:UDPglucose 6-dehydrogenase
MNIAVVGTGYVGLVTGTCFAETGNTVTCIDINAEKIATLKRGRLPIYEPDLESLFNRNITAGRLRFTTSLQEGISDAAIIFLALPTPPGENGSADLSYILGVAEDLGPLLTDYVVVVDKSTVPVGTAELVAEKISSNAKAESEFDVVSNPEFLREGYAVADFMKPDRVVIGASSRKARNIMDELYRPFLGDGSAIMHMDVRSAELTKYAANAFLATKISFMNEIANLCEKTGADVDSVREGIGADERIGKRFLYPGIGYGGSCFPKDVLALKQLAVEHEYAFRILEAVETVNHAQKEILLTKLENYYDDELEGKHFAVWGLAFKPDTDDIREAPSLVIIEKLLAAGATVSAYDPEAMSNVEKAMRGQAGFELTANQYDALEDADALLILTEWPQFKSPNWNKVDELMDAKVIFDGRNIYSPLAMEQRGYYYESIGRRIVQEEARATQAAIR